MICILLNKTFTSENYIFSLVNIREWRARTNTGSVKSLEDMFSLGCFFVIFLIPSREQTPFLTLFFKPLSFLSSDCHVTWVSAQASNETIARRLWDVSCDLLGIPMDWQMVAAGLKSHLQQTTQYSLPSWFSFRTAKSLSTRRANFPALPAY